MGGLTSVAPLIVWVVFLSRLNHLLPVPSCPVNLHWSCYRIEQNSILSIFIIKYNFALHLIYGTFIFISVPPCVAPLSLLSPSPPSLHLPLLSYFLFSSPIIPTSPLPAFLYLLAISFIFVSSAVLSFSFLYFPGLSFPSYLPAVNLHRCQIFRSFSFNFLPAIFFSILIVLAFLPFPFLHFPFLSSPLFPCCYLSFPSLPHPTPLSPFKSISCHFLFSPFFFLPFLYCLVLLFHLFSMSNFPFRLSFFYFFLSPPFLPCSFLLSFNALSFPFYILPFLLFLCYLVLSVAFLPLSYFNVILSFPVIFFQVLPFLSSPVPSLPFHSFTLMSWHFFFSSCLYFPFKCFPIFQFPTFTLLSYSFFPVFSFPSLLCLPLLDRPVIQFPRPCHLVLSIPSPFLPSPHLSCALPILPEPATDPLNYVDVIFGAVHCVDE